MEKVVLQATKRTITGKQVQQLRRAGRLPAVIYGHNVEPVIISLDAHEAGLILPRVSGSNLITIVVEGKEYPVLVREKQRNYIKNIFSHIDFLAVSLTEEIRTEVMIEITGVAPAVKDFNAIIVNGINSLEVECFPQDLPERVVVDISKLANLGDAIHVRDLKLSDKVKVLTDAEEMIAIATATKEEAVEEVAGAEAIEPELSVERGKKEEE